MLIDLHTFSSKSDEILILAALCLNLVFSKYIQIGWCIKFQVGLTRF